MHYHILTLALWQILSTKTLDHKHDHMYIADVIITDHFIHLVI